MKESYESMEPTCHKNPMLQLVPFTNFFAACAAVATAATMALAGIYIHRREFVTDEAKKSLAKISQQVTIPALLFSRIVYCEQNSSSEACPNVTKMMHQVWMLSLWPIYVVSCGLVVGHLVAKISNTPKQQRPLVLAACAFGNSTGLPITLLTVIHRSYPSSTELGRVDPTLFLSIYLLTYPILQWGVGGWILDAQVTKETEDKILTAVIEDGPPAHSHESTPLIISQASTVPENEAAVKSLMENIKLMSSKSLQPPVLAALAGILVASVSSIRMIFVDIKDRDNDAPLQFLFDGIFSIGQAAVPINMMILGINLSKTLKSSCKQNELLSPKSTVLVIIGKMICMPFIGICSTCLLRKYLLKIPDGIDDAFYLVLMMVFLTPTANNIMVMVELGTNVSKEGIARLIGWQYAVAPILLSMSVAMIVAVVHMISDW